jgi:hypothetical protein
MFGRRARWENNDDDWNRRRERENEWEQERNWPNENENNERWRQENERHGHMAHMPHIKVNDDVYTLIQAIIDNVITDNFDEFLYDEPNTSDTERVVRLRNLTFTKVSRQYITQNINMTFIKEEDRNAYMYNPATGYTLLYAAVFADNVRLARKLIESYNADTNALIQPIYDDNQEVYPAIFHCKSVEMLNLLHEHGAIIDGTFPELTYPSILFNYSYKYFEYKKNQRVSPDEEFTNGLFNILKRIIELGTDINNVNSDGSTVLHLYPTYGLAKLLLDNEYRVIRRTRIFNIHANNFAGDSIIHSVTADVRLVDYYKDEAIFDLNRLNRRNRNMLFAYINVIDELEFNRDASRYNGYNIIDIRDAMYKWIEYGVNINQLDIHGLCPLFIAKSDTVIDMLLKTRNMDTLPEENRIDIKIKNEFGRNKAFYMYNSISLRIFNTVLDSPSEISEFYSTLDNDNSNALYYTWNKDLFELLLSYGLDMYNINTKGESIIFGFYKSIFNWDWANQISRTISFIIDKSRRDGKSDDIFKRNDNNGRNIVHCVVIQMYIVLMLNAYVDDEAFFKRIYNPMYRKFYNTYNDGWHDNDKFSISNRDSILSIALIFFKNSGVTEFGSTDKCNNNIFSYIGFYEQFNKLREHMDYIGDIDLNGVYNDRIEGEGGEIITCEFDDYPSEDVRIQFLYPGDNILLRAYVYNNFNKMKSDHRIVIREYLYLLESNGIDIREVCNYQTPRTGDTVMHLILKAMDEHHGDSTLPIDTLLYDLTELKPSINITLTNNDGKTVVDLARDYIEKYNDNTANQLSRIFSLGNGIFNKPYNGICKDILDMQMADFFTATNEELGSDHGKKRIYFSHCPVCLEPVGRTTGCVYMIHNCSQINDNIFHMDLYDKFNVGGMIEWCTICGRITHNHYHYALMPHDTPKSEFTDHPIPAGMPTHDYWNCPGGNGVKEKVARMLKLREKYIEASEFVGVKTNAEVVYPIIEAVFDAPLQEGLLDAGQAALDANAWPGEIPELRCEGVKPAKEKRIKPYEVPAELVMPEFVEVGDNEYTYTGFDVPLWKFNHTMANGEEHPNVGENVVIMHLVGRGERLGLCPIRECGALFYPEEAETVLRGEGSGEIDNTVDLHEEYSVAPAGTTKKSLADGYRSFFTGQYYKIAGKPVEYIEGENEEEEDTAMCSLPRVEVAEPAVEPVAGENGNELPALEPVPGRGNNENGAPQEGGKRRRVKGTKRVHKRGGRKTIRRGKGGVLRKMPKKAAKTLYKKTNVKNAMKSKRRRV